LGRRISLAIVLHNHQPVGNFGWVIAEAFDQAYQPLVAALERHPRVRLAVHYSGPLLDWLAAERPEFLDRLAALAAADRIELLGGGYYEPVLASLPERDRLAQLRRMADAIERIGGRRPRGAWLAERVWEPDLPVSLVDGGYDWTILDDAHLRAASLDESRLWGSYTTDDQGRLLTVFGTSKGLRYRMPFGTVDEVIGYLREHAAEDGHVLGVMGDDGEKFGSWPGTYDHCWGSAAWVDRFFNALAAEADWLELVTPSDWVDRERPLGRAYIPTSSYAEMGEWALPADESRTFEAALHRAEREGLPEARWLRGGFWRNFQVKYREINELHKQMLRTSEKVARMADAIASDGAVTTFGNDERRLAEVATTELLQGQSNDCYWHGLFGGIYIAHMRLATYEHLIAAEDLADAAARRRGEAVDRTVRADTNLDGVAEILVTSPGQVVVIDPIGGGGIASWDIRPVRHALTAVLRRRPEAYHGRLRDADAAAAATAARSDGGRSGADGEVPSIHDLVRSREPGLSAHLHYDGYERRSGLVHLFAPGTTAEDFAAARADELGDTHDGPYEVVRLDDAVVLVRDVRTRDDRMVRVEKRFSFDGARRHPRIRLDVSIENRGDGAVVADVAIEWALMMLGGGGNPAAFYQIDGERLPHDGHGERAVATMIGSGNDQVGIELTTAIEPATTLWWAPIETVSNSEYGFERTYQGSALVAVWPVRLAVGERVSVAVDQRVAVTRDRSEDA